MKAVKVGIKTGKHLYYTQYKQPKQGSSVQYYNSNYLFPPPPPTPPFPPPPAFIFSSGGGLL